MNMKTKLFWVLCAIVMVFVGCEANEPTDTCQEEMQVAIELAKLVDAEDYEKIFPLLDKVMPTDGNSVRVVLPHEIEGVGYVGDGVCTIGVFDTNDSILTNSFAEDFWRYLQVEKSQMGAWQAYLIAKMWHYLPLIWHSGYSYRSNIYSKSSLGLKHARRHCVVTWNKVAPSIKHDVNQYLISVCYWSEFDGLIRENCSVSFDNGIVAVTTLGSEVLYEYNCGVMF